MRADGDAIPSRCGGSPTPSTLLPRVSSLTSFRHLWLQVLPICTPTTSTKEDGTTWTVHSLPRAPRCDHCTVGIGASDLSPHQHTKQVTRCSSSQDELDRPTVSKPLRCRIQHTSPKCTYDSRTERRTEICKNQLEPVFARENRSNAIENPKNRNNLEFHPFRFCKLQLYEPVFWGPLECAGRGMLVEGCWGEGGVVGKGD